MDSPLSALSEELTQMTGCPEYIPWEELSVESERIRLEEARVTRESTIMCTVVDSLTGEEHTFEFRTSRAAVEDMLPTFGHLQTHLRASVRILSKYSDEEFKTPYLLPLFAADIAASPFTEQIANDQIVFAHRHSAVSETLGFVSERSCNKFGLPDNCSWRSSRNWFCHALLMPHKDFGWVSQMGPMRKAHTAMLT
jgi:hypothetical protein